MNGRKRSRAVLSTLALLLVSLQPRSANALDIPLPTPPKDGRNELRCERLTSSLLEIVPDKLWNGMPTYRAVNGGSVVHECPDMAGEHIEIPREHYRNYQLTLRWTVRDASGYVVSTQLLPPYYLWGGVPEAVSPQPPMLQILASIRRALWGV
jgi:hypothetical protein